MERKIIIGYDGSSHGSDALALGRKLAEVLSATPVVVTCVADVAYLTGPAAQEKMVREETAPVLEAALEELAGMGAETHAVADSSPARALQEMAEAKGSLAIVIGSAHRGPVGRVLLGSVGEKLVTAAPCPVAVAPRGYGDAEAPKPLRVGVGVDDGAEAASALKAAIGLAERLHASLSLVNVQGAPVFGYGAAPGAGVGDLLGMEEEHANALLDKVTARVPQGLPVERRRLKGDAASEIAKASEDFDLLVVGSRRYGPVRRVLLGGVSARLMREAQCPLLITPRGAGEDPLGFANEH